MAASEHRDRDHREDRPVTEIKSKKRSAAFVEKEHLCQPG
jgi:hypothetical protein